jgi:hypothetical protein
LGDPDAAVDHVFVPGLNGVRGKPLLRAPDPGLLELAKPEVVRERGNRLLESLKMLARVNEPGFQRRRENLVTLRHCYWLRREHIEELSIDAFSLLGRSTLDLRQPPLETHPSAVAVNEHAALPERLDQQQGRPFCFVKRYELDLEPHALGQPGAKLSTIGASTKSDKHIDVASDVRLPSRCRAEECRERYGRLGAKRSPQLAQEWP